MKSSINFGVIFLVVMFLFLPFCFSASTTSTSGNISEYYYLVNVTDTSFLPSTIYSGNYVTLAIDVTNKGLYYSITNLVTSIELSDQFEPIDSNYFISLIKSESSKTAILSFKVKDNTPTGYYPATIHFSYNRTGYPVFDGNDLRSETYTINIPVSKTDKSLDVLISPSVINPGNPSQLTFTLQNNSGVSISNVSLSWSESSSLVLPIGSDNKRYISSINSGESSSVAYNVAADPEITTGIYPLSVTLSYNDSNGLKTQTSQVGLIVGGGTDFEVSAESNSSGTVSISVANIGSNNANAVVVKIPEQQGVSVSGSNTSILGNLNKGDYTLTSFSITSSRSGFSQDSHQVEQNQKPSTSQMPKGQMPNGADFNISQNTPKSIIVEIDYTDTTGERKSIEKKISLSSTATTTTNYSRTTTKEDNSFFSWIILGIIIIGGVIYNKLKSKMSWKKLGVRLVIIVVLFGLIIFILNSNLIAIIVGSLISVLVLFQFFTGKFPFIKQNSTFGKALKK